MKITKLSLSLFATLVLFIVYLSMYSVSALIGQDGTPDGTPTLDPISLTIGAVAGGAVGIGIGTLVGKYTTRKRAEVLKSNITDDPNARKHTRTGHVTLMKRGESPPQAEGRKILDTGEAGEQISEESASYRGKGVKSIKDMGNSGIATDSSTIKEGTTTGKKEYKGHVTLLK